MVPFKEFFVGLMCLILSFEISTIESAILKRGKIKKLVGGEEIPSRELSEFIVSLRTMPEYLHNCGGFLVSRQHVVTIAKCVLWAETKELYAYVNPLKWDEKGEYYRVDKVQVHPKHYGNLHNIALLTLNRTVEDSHNLLTLAEMLPEENSLVLSYGWGYNKIPGPPPSAGNWTLRAIKLKTLNQEACIEMIGHYVPCETVCASTAYMNRTKFTSLKHDLGTPLVGFVNNTAIAFGMLAQPTDRRVMTAQYLSIPSYYHWISKLIQYTRPTSLPVPPSTRPVTDKIYGEPTLNYKTSAELAGITHSRRGNTRRLSLRAKKPLPMYDDEDEDDPVFL